MDGLYAYSSDIWPALMTLALVIFLGAYSWRRRYIPAARPFVIACGIGVIWSLGVILELSAVSFPAKVFWVQFQAVWHLPAAAVITCFILHYAGLGRWLTPRTYALLFFLPLLSVLFIVTNDLHHLIWTGFRMNNHVVASPGKMYWFFKSYIFLLGVVNLAVLVRLAIRSPGQRLPVAIILLCQFLARIVYATDKLDIIRIGPGESILLTVGLMAAAYAVALLGFHAIDPVAAARRAALQQMREGLIVLDLQGRISKANPMAAKMLATPENRLRNKPFQEVMSVDVADLGWSENQETFQKELALEIGGTARQYRLHLTSLRGRGGEVIGKLILLHDITEQKRAQKRILEQQSVVAMLKEREHLAREIHDGIAQVLGYAGIQTQTALKCLQDGNAEQARSLLGRLVEVTNDAHADIRESILNLKTGKGPEWSFIPTLKSYIGRFQANYGIPTELSISDGIEENTFDPAAGVHLLRVIQEALTNCRNHSGAHAVKVSMELNGTKACITITDDGQGFDASLRDVCDGDHFGLVFMRERMEQVGGSFNIDSIPGSGTVLKLDVPIREHGKEIR